MAVLSVSWKLSAALTNLYHEGDKTKRVVVQHHAADITHDGVGATYEHAAHIPPVLPSEAEV